MPQASGLAGAATNFTVRVSTQLVDRQGRKQATKGNDPQVSLLLGPSEVHKGLNFNVNQEKTRRRRH
jgi:hypothetical protein